MRLFVPERRRFAHDERCRCGHPRSEHDDRWATYNGAAVNVPGKGRCDAAGCACAGFKFEAWIFDEDAHQAVC
jgi:hypothetical protein